MQISVVIPALNERDNIAELIPALKAAMPAVTVQMVFHHLC